MVSSAIQIKLLARFLEGYDVGPVLDVVLFESGIENSNYRVVTRKGSFVLRVYSECKGSHAKVEVEVLEFLLSKGIPVPRIVKDSSGYALGKVGDSHAALFSYVEGSHIPPAPMDLCLAREIARSFAKLQDALSEFITDIPIERPKIASYRVDKNLLSSLLPQEKFDAELISRIESVQENRGELCFIHSDITRENVLVGNGRVKAFLDFDDFHKGPIEYDTSVALTQLFVSRLYGIDFPGLELFFSEYKKSINGRGVRVQDILPWMLIRNAQLALLIRDKISAGSNGNKIMINDIASIEKSALSKLKIIIKNADTLSGIFCRS